MTYLTRPIRCIVGDAMALDEPNPVACTWTLEADQYGDSSAIHAKCKEHLGELTISLRIAAVRHGTHATVSRRLTGKKGVSIV